MGAILCKREAKQRIESTKAPLRKTISYLPDTTSSRIRISTFVKIGTASKLGMPRSALESKIRSLKVNKNRFKATNSLKNS
jgi:hypothetical protein